MQLNRFQRAIMNKRDKVILGYLKKGLTYKQISDILLRHHKIKLSAQRIGIIARQFEDQEVTRSASKRNPVDFRSE